MSIEIVNSKRIIPEQESKVFIKKVLGISSEFSFSPSFKSLCFPEKCFESMLKALEEIHT